MKIVRFEEAGVIRYGVLEDGYIAHIEGDNPYRADIVATSMKFNVRNVRMLAPCAPSKIVALGLNYRSHGEEMSHRIPEEPLIFIKPSTCVIGPEEVINYPACAERVDYEGELGIVIRDVTRNVRREDAARHILGYTCCNDVTARDIQARDKQWTRAKSFDTFGPIGPWIETELDPGNLRLQTRLNGEVKQDTSTADMIFPADYIVSFISDVMTLLPGDVIATGTTAGIGPMQRGDTVEVEIEGIGVLKNTVQ